MIRIVEIREIREYKMNTKNITATGKYLYLQKVKLIISQKKKSEKLTQNQFKKRVLADC